MLRMRERMRIYLSTTIQNCTSPICLLSFVGHHDSHNLTIITFSPPHTPPPGLNHFFFFSFLFFLRCDPRASSRRAAASDNPGSRDRNAASTVDAVWGVIYTTRGLAFLFFRNRRFLRIYFESAVCVDVD